MASDTAYAFIQSLRTLDGAMLARLRRGDTSALGQVLATVAVPDARPYEMVATLYPHNQRHGRTGGMGQTMRDAATRNPAFAAIIETRFIAAMNAQDLEYLRHPLEYCIRRAAMDKVGIDWSWLLDDLTRWEEPKRVAARSWAHDFWS